MTAADLERWEGRWRQRQGPPGLAEPFLVANAGALPPGSVLDLAAGDGRNALWLAARGFAVTAVDIAPTALARLEAAAGEAGLAVTTRLADLDAPTALDGLGPFDSLVAIRYRPSAGSWPRLIARLRPGGRLLLCSFGLAQAERGGMRRTVCLGRDELLAEIGRDLVLCRWEESERDGASLAGSLWARPRAGTQAGAAAMAS